jgi:primosomal protein N'
VKEPAGTTEAGSTHGDAATDAGNAGDAASDAAWETASDTASDGTAVAMVLPDVRAVRAPYRYRAEGALGRALAVGDEVVVGLRGRRVRGWVVEVRRAAHADAAVAGLAPVLERRARSLPEALMVLARWAAWRWACSPVVFLRTAASLASRARVARQPAPDRPGLGAGVASSARFGSVVDRTWQEARVVIAEVAARRAAAVRWPPLASRPALVAALLEQLVHGSGDQRGASSREPGVVLLLAPTELDVAATLAGLERANVPAAPIVAGDDRRRGAAALVRVGTRGAVFAPLGPLRAVVVLEAEDDRYVEQRRPHWRAWEVAIERARLEHAIAVAVSSCPPVELTEAVPLVVASRALERSGWPPVDVIDLSAVPTSEGLISEKLVRRMHAVLARGGRVVAILNRKGLATATVCRSCGELQRCSICGAALRLVAPTVLDCPRCGATQAEACGRCGGAVVPLAPGAQGAAALVRARLGLAPGDPRLAVGTEAVLASASGAELVAFVDFDLELFRPSLRAAEAALALVARAARVAGGALEANASNATLRPGRRAPGRIVLQTRAPSHEAVRAALHADPGILERAEREMRRQLGLPPFGAVAVLEGPGVEQAVGTLRGFCGLEVAHGPGRVVVRTGSAAALADALAAIGRLPAGCVLTVDPRDL